MTSAEQEPTKSLTPTERRLAALLLEMASDKFSNHGCDDFRLDEQGGMESREDRRNLVLAMERWNGDKEELKRLEEMPDSFEFTYVPDWYLMSYLAARLEGKA